MPSAAQDEQLPVEPPCFGRYRIVRELGKGGMAQVYEARHTELDRRVALKVMQPTLAAQPSAAARFLREAKAACQIRHQHVVEVFEIGIDHGLPYIVMEFLEGANLAILLAEKGPLPLFGLASIFLPVISAVATAHSAGVVHRDLKPANLMLVLRSPRPIHPMVLDFGISKIENEELENTLTRSESLLGTIQYMAPEITKGAKFASPASDQYALGVALYECATGQRPFRGQSHYELMHAIVTAPVVPPSRLRADLPSEFDALVERAMNRDPAKRFPSVHALGSALLSFGDRATWALWEREFLGSAPASDPWAIDAGTLHDVSDHRACAPARPSPRGISVPSHRMKAGLAFLALYAAGATAMLVRGARQPGSGETTADPYVSPSVMESSHSSLPSRAAVRPAGENAATPDLRVESHLSLPRDRVANDRRPGASERTDRMAIHTPDGSRGAIERSVSAPDTTTPQLPDDSDSTARKLQPAQLQRPWLPKAVATPTMTDQKTPPAPPVHEGTNGAPIVD
jgi:eukaryotic-like serine/threonine-protein kinase